VVEGLALVKSAHGVTGYAGVVFDGRKSNQGKPYAVYLGRKTKGSFLGCFATAEEAALVRSRHTGDVVDRVVAVGAPSHVSGKRPSTVVCRAPSCGALVDLGVASRSATANGRSNYVVGDGCGSPTCSKVYRSQWVGNQIKMADDLLQGRRRLITWPSAMLASSGRSKDTSWLYVGEAETRLTAEAALTAMNSIEKPRRGRPPK